MAKRKPEKQMTKDDCDVSDEAEESGVFQKADGEEIARRVMKTAKRRMVNSNSSGPSPFANFAGFSAAPSGEPFSFFNKPDQKKNSESIATICNNSSTSNNNDKKEVGNESLKALNMSCLKWITDHLNKNPYVVLMPVFKDYEKHLASLNIETGPLAKKQDNFEAPSIAPTPTATSTFGGFTSFWSSPITKINSESSTSIPTTTSTFPAFSTTAPFSFASGSSPFNNKPLTTSIDLGGISNNKPAIATSGFSFKVAPPTETAKPSEAVEKPNDDEPSDETPQTEFVPVKEEGSVFDIRCKVFIKKDKFVPIGVGTLYLKLVAGGKAQLIARADTSQGSVLLNLILTPDLPLQTTGANNVLIVCVPTPDVKPPPVPVLIRVKNSEERDKLLGEMERLRGM